MAGNYVVLWHGTSRRNALKIEKTGFHAGSYFAQYIEVARGRATLKRRRKNPGVLILCKINLNLYEKQDYEKSKGGHVYCFIPPVPKNTVVNIFRINEFNTSELKQEANLLRNRLKSIERHNRRRTQPRRRRPRKLKIKRIGPEVVIARNCGAEGLAYWLNTYLATYIDGQIAASHSGIKQISMWVEKNYANGRISPISNREMLMQVERYIPELSGTTHAIRA